MVARQYVLLDYDCPNELLEKATAVTPGLEGPTVSPLQTPGWSAVRAADREIARATAVRARAVAAFAASRPPSMPWRRACCTAGTCGT